MRIGIIGSGKIASVVGRLWAQAGHAVLFGSRSPASVAGMAAEMGAEIGDQAEAARFGDVTFTAVSYGLWPELAARLAPTLAGRPVLDAANPYPDRDGVFAAQAVAAGLGSGVGVARLLPGAFYVRAFNSVYYEILAREAHRRGERLAIPLAGDDLASLDVAAGLVRDAGFAPVVVGGLVQAPTFDVGAPAYNNPMTAPALERLLGLAPPG